MRRLTYDFWGTEEWVRVDQSRSMIAALTSGATIFVPPAFLLPRNSRKSTTISTLLVLLVFRVCFVRDRRWRARSGARVSMIDVKICDERSESHEG